MYKPVSVVSQHQVNFDSVKSLGKYDLWIPNLEQHHYNCTNANHKGFPMGKKEVVCHPPCFFFCHLCFIFKKGSSASLVYRFHSWVFWNGPSPFLLSLSISSCLLSSARKWLWSLGGCSWLFHTTLWPARGNYLFCSTYKNTVIN